MASSTRETVLARFENPPAAYRPMMFWIWNGVLEEETVRAQVRDMAEKGCGGFFFHPMGENFRLKDFIQGQWPPYLSDGYFQAVRWATEEAAEQGIYAWLYDEGGWPSGTAQGKVLEGHPEHTAQVLQMEQVTAAAGPEFVCPAGTVAALAVFRDHAPEVLEIVSGTVTVPSLSHGVLLFRAATREGRVDLLSHAAVARFIEVTHEQYVPCVGEYFGTVVPGMFTDEPAVSGAVGTDAIPWTGDMLLTFERDRGFDLRPFLPALFASDQLPDEVLRHLDEADVFRVRCEFSDHWTDLYHSAYWLQINRWCERHHLIHTGHVGGEDNLPDHGRHGFGHFFKTAGALHAPGVDAIWRQICWDKDNFDFPLFASSAAHQRPGQGGAPDEESPFDNLVITETNGVYGYGLTFEQMRWLVDYQCLRGINLIGQMSYSYTTEGGRLYRTMDHVGPGNPLWPLFKGHADYVGRLCSVLRSGVALADIAVYYPIESVWADPRGPSTDRAWKSLQAITRALTEEQVAFDYIDAETIQRAGVSEGALETDGQFYGTIVVPEASVLPVGVLKALLSLYESGGRVVFLDEIPRLAADFGKQGEFETARDSLVESSVAMDRESESGRLGGDTREGLSEVARWDGLAAGLGMPRQDYFPSELLEDKAVIVVADGELARLARLLALRAGHYGFQVSGLAPELRLAVRDLGDLQVAFLMNESQEPIHFELEIVRDQPVSLEQWDPVTGERELLAMHGEVAEITRVPFRMRAGESALLVLDPDTQPEIPAHKVRKLSQPVIIEVLDEPERVYIVSDYRIIDGDVDVRTGQSAERELPSRIGSWDDLDLIDFSGTVAYEFTFTIAPEYLAGPVYLDLGTVQYAARVVLNETELPLYGWPPFVHNVTRALQQGENRLRVEVTNTLANQCCKESVVHEARDRGWFNTYFERSLPMMSESLPSGLLGPVRLYIEV